MGWKRQIHSRQNLSSLFLPRWYLILFFPYQFFQIEGKNANNGVWPVDLSKIRFRPGGINYIFNILTGYYYKPPYGIDIPKGKYFNPYYDHMIIGMPRVSYIFQLKNSHEFLFSNFMMVCSNTKMVPPLPLPNWLMMSPTSSLICKEETVTRDPIKKSETSCKTNSLKMFNNFFLKDLHWYSPHLALQIHQD